MRRGARAARRGAGAWRAAAPPEPRAAARSAPLPLSVSHDCLVTQDIHFYWIQNFKCKKDT